MSIQTNSAAPDAPAPFWRGLGFGLSSRLLMLTICFVFVIEALIFLPSATNYRANWIENRLDQARLAALALDAAPMREVSDELADALLMRAEVVAVAEIYDGMRQQLLVASELPRGTLIVEETRDLRTLQAVDNTLGAMLGSGDRWLRIVDPALGEDHLEILVPIRPLKQGLIQYAFRILLLSLVIAVVVGAAIYATLFFIVVRPIKRVTASVEQFRDNPRDWTTRLEPTQRSDEIGRAQNALSDMEVAVQAALRQRERLAQLGEAVAKINHDLRNSLAAAQLVTDTLSRSDDPRIQRAAPRLERALQRAISLAEATLSFGKGEPVGVQMQTVSLAAIIEEAVQEGVSPAPDTAISVEVDGALVARADPEFLHRIVVNLTRNAAQAMAKADTPTPTLTVRAEHAGSNIIVSIADAGPGIPERVRAKLFQPFATSRDGTGLGLAIAAELATAMEADLTLGRTGADGTCFELRLKAASG